MSQGEVSLWIRVRDGFTAGFKAAAGATANFGKSVGDVARGASTAVGGELSRIWGALSNELSSLLGNIPGVSKLGGAIKGSITAAIGGAVAAGMGIKNLIDGISDEYRRLAKEMEQTGIEIAAKQAQILSKIKSSKTSEADNAISRDITGEIAQLEKKIAGLRSDIDGRNATDFAKSWWGGTQGMEEGYIQKLTNDVEALKQQKKFTDTRAGLRSSGDYSAEAQKVAENLTRNQEQAANAMADAARDIAMANNADEGGALQAESDRLKSAITDLYGKLNSGAMEWTDANRSALNGLVSDYKQTSISLIKFREQEAKSASDAEFKAGRDAAEKTKALVVAAEKKAGEERQKAMEAQGKALVGEAKRRGGLAIDAAQAAADRANFRNNPETFKQKLDAFIARREEKQAADKDNQKLLEREAKIREKLQRGIGLSKKDEQLLKDMSALRAGQRADAAAAAKKKQVEDAIINIEKKVESVLQASGGPN